MWTAAIPELLWTLGALAAGAWLGKFAALASLRLPQARLVRWADAGCEACGARPNLFTALPLGGLISPRCPTCQTPLPRRYPMMEAGGFGLAAWAAIFTGGPLGLIGAILGAWLLLLAVLDGEHLWLPLPLTTGLVLFGLIVTAAASPADLPDHLIGAGAGFAALWVLALAYKKARGFEGLGGGDAWLAAAAGAWVGWRELPYVVLIAAVSGLVLVGILLALRRMRADRPIPFGVFLAIGLWIVWVHGPF